MPVNINPLLQNPLFLYIQKKKKKSNPKCASSITSQIYFYLLAFGKQKGRKTFTHIYDSSDQRQNKIVFECIFQTPNITPETTEAKMKDFNLSPGCCFTS